MDACDYCKGYNNVRWDLEAGDICEDCLSGRRAKQQANEEAQELAEADERRAFGAY